MTVKPRIITLPKSTMVSFEPPRAHTGSKRAQDVPQRIVYWDKNGDGLDAHDVAFVIYDSKRPPASKRKGICAFGCNAPKPRLEIYRRSITGRDVRLYRTRFKKLVKEARKQRAWMSGIPEITDALCYAYANSILPLPVRVTLKPALTRMTKLTSKPLKRMRIPRSKVVDPRRCRAIEAKVKVARRDVELKNIDVTVTWGGALRSMTMSVLLALRPLLKVAAKLTAYPSARHMIKGAEIVHMGLNRL